MKCDLQHEQKLEQSEESNTEKSFCSAHFALGLDNIWRFFSQIMRANTEPHVRQWRDRYGDTQYRVYDPKTGRMAHYSSENELRIWLDQRHYL